MAEQPQLTPLGEVWSYNNAGFYVAGRVIEVVTGKPYEEALQRARARSARAGATFFFPDDVMTPPLRRRPRQGRTARDIVARPWPIGRSSHPAGGLITSVPELLRYARFWIDGGDLLRPDSVEEMTREQVPIGGNLDAVGLSWMLRTIDGVKTIGHGGGTKGQSTALVIAPEQGFALAVFTNHSYGGVVTDRVVEKAREAYLGIREPELEPIGSSGAVRRALHGADGRHRPRRDRIRAGASLRAQGRVPHTGHAAGAASALLPLPVREPGRALPRWTTCGRASGSCSCATRMAASSGCAPADASLRRQTANLGA